MSGLRSLTGRMFEVTLPPCAQVSEWARIDQQLHDAHMLVVRWIDLYVAAPARDQLKCDLASLRNRIMSSGMHGGDDERR
jgi:hypothetical protein